MTPYKSRPKWGYDRIEVQERFTPSHSHLLQSMVGYDCSHLFASVHQHLVSRYARRLVPSSPSCALWADCHASAVPRAENVGRTRPLDASLHHRLALAPRAQGRLLGGASGGRMVGRGSVADLATTQGRDTASGGGWQCQTQAGDAESLGPKRAEKRASALVFRHPVCPVDCLVGRLSAPRGLSPDSAQNWSGVPDGKCLVP